MIDVIIPTHVKDTETLELCIEQARKNVLNVNKVYVISKDKLTDSAEWIPESAFPFSLVEVSDIIGETWRTTWYYQQVLKFYAHEACDGLLDDYLIVDSDTMFLRPIDFYEEESGKIYFNFGYEKYPSYDEHMKKLVPGLNRVDDKSGITHSMVFSRDILTELKKTVELKHDSPLWKAFLDITNHKYLSVDNQSHDANGRASEYEIYFNYARTHFRDRVICRPLNSILAYKGNLHKVKMNFGSRTNRLPAEAVIDNTTEEFSSLEESFRYVIDKTRENNYDSVTFQKHTRQDFDEYKNDSVEYLRENTYVENK